MNKDNNYRCKIKVLNIDLNKVNNTYKKPKYRYIPIDYDDDKNIPNKIDGYELNNLPQIPKDCKKNLDKICSTCPYYVPNQATLLEFDKLIDKPDFNKRAFIGVLGTDTRIKCPYNIL